MDQPTPRQSRGDYHRPVMVDEVLGFLEPVDPKVVIDATFGGGGHSRAILDRFADARVVGVDRDPDAVAQAFDDPRLTVVRDNFANLAAVVERTGVADAVDAIVVDLGVSSYQLDEGSRGFSYHRSGPLDMRMGPDAPRTAAELIDDATIDDLTRILRDFGEERHARRIAAAIIENRPFASTADLAACVADAVPAAARRRKHPARRTFQALRIAVNGELAVLHDALAGALELLRPRGRLIVLAYHSLEDRIVKRLFADRSQGCVCPPDLPVCQCNADPDVRLIAKGVKPSDAEVADNPRARSAILRVVEKAPR